MIHTVTRLGNVGKYRHSGKVFEQAMARCKSPVERVDFGDEDIVKYFLYGKSSISPYALMISHNSRKDNPNAYNTTLTVASEYESRSLDVAEKFQTEAGIRLDIPVPEPLKVFYSGLGKLLGGFLDDQVMARTILSGEYKL